MSPERFGVPTCTPGTAGPLGGVTVDGMPIDRPRSGNSLGKLSDAVPPLTAALTEAIRAAYADADSPSYTTLNTRNRRAGRGVLSKATISRILKPDPEAKDQKSLPGWTYYKDLLQVLGHDPATYEDPWKAAQREWQERPLQTGQTSSNEDPVQPAGKPWWRRRWFLFGAPVSVATVLLAAIFLPPLLDSADSQTPNPDTNSSERPDTHRDNTDPHQTGCTPQLDEQTYWTHLYRDWPTNADINQTDTLITMHYSPECRTSWAVLEQAPPGTQAVLHRNSDGVELRCTAGLNGSCTTKQLSGRGTTIYASARAGNAYGQTRSH